MPSVLLVYRRSAAVVSAFEEVVKRWRLSPCQIDCVAGMALPGARRSRARHPPFVVERMSLIVEIDVQLTSLMDEWEIPEWLRERVPGAFPNSPLDEMLGSTDRIRRIRDLLEPEVRQ